MTLLPRDRDAGGTPVQLSVRSRNIGGAALKRIAIWGLVALVAVAVLAPVIEVQYRAFSNGARGYRDAFTSPRIGETLTSTTELGVGALAFALVLGTLLAWWASCLPTGFGWLRVFPVLPLVTPAISAVVGWSFLLEPRIGLINELLRNLPWWRSRDSGPFDIYTLPWIIIITGLWLTSFVYLFVSSGLKNINGELMEAAEVAGASSLRTFFSIVLPMLRPALIYSTVVCLLLSLGQFTAPLLLGRTEGVHVLTIDMYTYISRSPTDLQAAAALASPLMLLGLILVVGQRTVLGDHTRFVSRGGKAFRQAGRPSWFAVAGTFVYGLVAAVLPLLALVAVALAPFWSGSVSPSAWTLKNFTATFNDGNVIPAVENSLLFSIAAIAICLPAGYVIASILARTSKYAVSRAILDILVGIPLAIPAVVLGAGLLLAYIRPQVGLYATSQGMIFAYATLMVPYSVRLQLSALLALGNSHIEASRVAGAGEMATTVRIILPMLRPALGGAASLMFILLSHEFAASLLLRGPDTQVMGTVLYDRFVTGPYSEVAVISIVMTAVTTVGLVVAFFLGGRSVLDRL